MRAWRSQPTCQLTTGTVFKFHIQDKGKLSIGAKQILKTTLTNKEADKGRLEKNKNILRLRHTNIQTERNIKKSRYRTTYVKDVRN